MSLLSRQEERARAARRQRVHDAAVASLEVDETPYPERVRVPEITAERVNTARRSGHRVVAVGTAVVRALPNAQVRATDTGAGLGKGTGVDHWMTAS